MNDVKLFQITYHKIFNARFYHLVEARNEKEAKRIVLEEGVSDINDKRIIDEDVSSDEQMGREKNVVIEEVINEKEKVELLKKGSGNFIWDRDGHK